MTVAVSQGLDRVNELYRDRSQRVRELKIKGKKIIGYHNLYPVLEMISALDLVPYQIMGDMNDPITKADSLLPTVVCPFLRSMLDQGLKGKFDFLDGLVMAHICEVAEKTAHIWHNYLNPPYFYFIDTPHTTHQAALNQFKELLKDFQGTLESFTGQELTPRRLSSAIKLYNEQRSLVRQLYELRKADPPPISGSETMRVMIAITGLPVEEGNDLLQQVISEVKERKITPGKKLPRLLIWGSIIDNTAIIDMVESAGASIVMDDTDLGSRAYFPLVETTKDPLDGLARRYLVELKSPRTFRTPPIANNRKDYASDLKSRFSYLADYARDWKVDGVLMLVLRFCDIHGYEVPGLREYLDGIGLPSIYLEHDYSPAVLAPLKTRVQAFLEVIG